MKEQNDRAGEKQQREHISQKPKSIESGGKKMDERSKRREQQGRRIGENVRKTLQEHGWMRGWRYRENECAEKQTEKERQR